MWMQNCVDGKVRGHSGQVLQWECLCEWINTGRLCWKNSWKNSMGMLVNVVNGNVHGQLARRMTTSCTIFSLCQASHDHRFWRFGIRVLPEFLFYMTPTDEGSQLRQVGRHIQLCSKVYVRLDTVPLSNKFQPRGISAGFNIRRCWQSVTGFSRLGWLTVTGLVGSVGSAVSGHMARHIPSLSGRG